MDLLRFAYYKLFFVFIPLLVLIALYRWRFSSKSYYVYALTDVLRANQQIVYFHHKKILGLLRCLTLSLLAFFIARPQFVDTRSKVNVDGVDIVIAIDISGSMQIFDDLQDRRSRIDVAKQEAIRFIEKRTNDSMGVVVFAADALSICPLTLDKAMLKQLVGELAIGFVNPDGTLLGTGLATGINRLRCSPAKSKVLILLTDGKPEGNEKINTQTATVMAKQFNIKVYTIGIGNAEGGFIANQFGMIQRIADAGLDHTLLKTIADQTGGKYFEAHNPKEMRQIYDHIDALEKTEKETSIFHHYYEIFSSMFWIILVVVAAELIGRLWLWRGLA